MNIKLCPRCGAKCFMSSKGNWICPNHGFIEENASLDEWRAGEKDINDPGYVG